MSGDPEDDVWERVAREAMAREARREVEPEKKPKGPVALSGARSATCSACGKTERFAESGAFVVHFATLAAQRPCTGSWKYPCAACGQLLVAAKDGGLTHLATGSKECSIPTPPPEKPNP